MPTDFFGATQKLQADTPILVFTPLNKDQSPASVYMMIRADPDNLQSPMLIGSIDPTFLWGIGHHNILPALTDLCIVDQNRKIIVSSFEVPQDLLHKITIKLDPETSRSFMYRRGSDSYFIAYWPLFLKSHFHSASLNIILRSNTSETLLPLNRFKKTFPLVMLLSFWIVLLLSIVQIRKSLVPLELLKKATVRISEHDFKTKVDIDSQDEFEELANSFNQMTSQIDEHFSVMQTRAEIDRTLLSSLNTSKIIHTVLKQMLLFFPIESVSVNIRLQKQPTTFHSYVSTNSNERLAKEEYYNINPDSIDFLTRSAMFFIDSRDEQINNIISKYQQKSGHSFFILPLTYDKLLKGTVSLGVSENTVLTHKDQHQARQISDQVIIALSNSMLFEELEKLNLGTLEALARATDAKSEWTAGHSERVAELALRIATVMGYTKRDLEILRRAAYLHDIGKIGIRSSILDKPDRLTEEEFKLIKEHPLIGWRILEPIEAYEDVLHIIAQHHEKYNGEGYPFGISGDNIVLGARILAVADVYDAIISDRPYRGGMDSTKSH